MSTLYVRINVVSNVQKPAKPGSFTAVDDRSLWA